MPFVITVLQDISGTPPLSGALVTATNVNTSAVYTATSDDIGTATINAPEGGYTLSVSAVGYVTATTGRINFGTGGGYIMALDPVSGGGGGDTGSTTAYLIFGGLVIGGILLFILNQ